MFEVSVEGQFASAHWLRDYEGACERLHGHNYKVELAVCGSQLAPNGLLLDFKILKTELARVLEILDHRCLNELEFFNEEGLNPTAENIAMWIANKISKSLPENVEIKHASVWESEKSRATYYPEETNDRI